MWTSSTLSIILVIVHFSLFINAFERRPGVPEIIKIGGFFDETDVFLESVFRHAIDATNTNGQLAHSQLQPVVETLDTSQSFAASKTICDAMQEGVWAMFGPSDSDLGWLFRSYAYHQRIPHLLFQWDHRSLRKYFEKDIELSNFTLNLYPDANTISQAYLDLVEWLEWKRFTVLYQENEDLVRVKDLLRITARRPKVLIKIRQYSDNPIESRKLFKEMKKQGEFNIVLSVKLDKIEHTLERLQLEGLLTDYHKYIITSLDTHTLNFDRIMAAERRPEIYSFSMLYPVLQNIPYAKDNLLLQEHQGMENVQMTLTHKAALLYDAINLMVRALGQNLESPDLSKPPKDCEGTTGWEFGATLMDFMKKDNETVGYSGPLAFDEYGQRTNVAFTLLQLDQDGTFKNASTWTKSAGLVKREEEDIRGDIQEKMKKIVFRVTTSKNEPYIMYKKNWTQLGLTGNDRFEGYCVDLLDEIAKHLPFNYTIIHKEPPQTYGKQAKNGTWIGLLGDLINREADMAITDLTITHSRRTGVDFTTPFMNLGIAIMFKKSGEDEPKYFAFLDPFSTQVWLCTLTALMGVSYLMFVISRITPYEWVSDHPCEPEPEELSNQFSIGNCLWFTLGSIMQQGSDLAPRAISTRTLASVWFFFTLIIVSSYTANLAAVLTNSLMATPIQSAEDLVKQSEIVYGCKEGGSTYDFFKNTNHPIYQRMWGVMQSTTPSVFAQNDQEGIDRTLKGKYAYLMESSSIEYQASKNCSLEKIGDLLDQKNYGIALPPGSPYTSAFTYAILLLQEDGTLDELKKRWWKDKVKEAREAMGQKECDPVAPPSSGAEKLDITSVGGVFMVLVVGTFLGCLLVLLEYVWKAKKVARHERKHIAAMMVEELKRIWNRGGGTKELPRRKSQSSSHPSSPSSPSIDGRSAKLKSFTDLDSAKLEKYFSPFAEFNNNKF